MLPLNRHRTTERNTRKGSINKYDIDKGSSGLFGIINFKMSSLPQYNQIVYNAVQYNETF